MTKAELINEIAIATGFDKKTITIIVESYMDLVKKNVANGENVYLRGFGSFITKKRAAKIARNISKKTSIQIPEHNIPAFKPSAEFLAEVR
ncbi:MAG: integration host factor subunit beta [Paludibacteraceae bacterium]|nr:integration host factor subunit beta [Paludibacteraceae bacterium]MBQ9296342.1 integration host factor subunit beta [Paludibacteraceae bacterium]